LHRLRINAFYGPKRARGVARSVIPNGGYQRDASARACCGHGLIAALAAMEFGCAKRC
jgi:hypothetical protein